MAFENEEEKKKKPKPTKTISTGAKAAEKFAKNAVPSSGPKGSAGQKQSHSDVKESIRSSTSKLFSPSRQSSVKTWYKGSKPTETEALAQILKISETDRATAEKAYGFYEQAKAEGEWAETYDKATSPYLASLGIDDPSQINDDFFAANAHLYQQGVHTSTGALSSAKKNGPGAMLAYNLSGLHADYNATKELKAEQDQMVREAQYWMSKGLSDDEIKAKLNIGGEGSKYKKIGSALDAAKVGKFTPTTDKLWAATSWGVDGMLWSLRNPGKSSGDYFTDAIQKDMGRGTPYTADPTAQAKRDRGSAAWAPYSNGTTMDDTAMKLGVKGKDGFSRDDAWWAQKRSEALASGDDDTIKAYKKAWEAEEFTRQAEEEAAEFRDYMARQIESGASVEDIFNEYLFEDNGWENLGKMYDDYMGGIPSDITRSIDFDIAEYKRMAEESYIKKTGVYSTPEYESQITDATGGVKTNDEASQKIEEGYKLNHDIQNKPFIQGATNSELKSMRMYNTPSVPKAGQPRMMAAAGSMSDVSFVTYDAIQNGTGGKQQMDIAKQKSAVGFANENFVDAITNMNIQVQSEADYFKGANEGAYNLLSEYDAFKPILENGKIPTDDEFYAVIEQTFNTPDMLMSPEKQMLEEAWAQSAGAREFAADAVVGETEKQAAGQEMYDNIEASVADAFGRDTDNYRSVMATYEAAIPYVRGVPKTYNAYDPYQMAAMQEGATPESTAAVLTNSRCQNARNIRYLQAQVDNFKELGLPQEIIDNAQQQLDDLIAQNEILNAHKLQENEDFDAQVAAFDSAFVGNNAPSGASPQSDEINRIIANPGSGKALYQSMMGQQGSQMNVEHLKEYDDLASYMTDGERGNYKYIAMTQGVDAAAQYFLNLEENLSVRRYQETTEATSEFASQNAGTAALATAGSVLLSPFEALEGIDTLVSGLFGEKQNPYDNLISATKSAAREGTKDLAADALKDNPVALSIFNVLYDATTSGADSALTGLVGGGGIGGSILMGLSGFENAVNDALMRGTSQKDAFIYGIASAAIEAYTEKSQISKMFEAFDAGSAGVKGFMETVLSGFASEAYEEGLSSFLGTVADDYIMQSMSNRDLAIQEYMALGLTEEEAKIQASRDVMTDILYSGLVGGISGAETSGAGYVGGKLLGKSDVQSEQTTEPGTPQERAVAALATATAPGVGEAQQAATVTGALASFEVAPDEANAASKTIVSNGWVRKVQNMFSTATDPNTLSEAITWAVNTASSKAASIMKENINPNNVVDAVGRLVEAYKAERQNPELAAEYDAAVTESMEADETVKIQEQLKKENSRYDRAEADVTKEKAKLAKAREDIAAYQSARQEIAAENAKLNERLKENPANTQASAKMIANKQKWSDLGKQIAAINQTIPAIKNAVKKAAQALQTVTDDIANEARSMAKEVVAQRKAEAEALKAQEAEQAEQQRSSEIVDPDSFIQSTAEHTPEQKAEIRAYHNATNSKMLEAAEMYKNNPGAKNTRVLLSEVGEREGAEIQRLTGIDVTGYTHTADKSFFRHVEDRHGEQGEQDMSMKNLPDVARVGWVIENYDSLDYIRDDDGEIKRASGYLDKNREHMPLIRYTKQLDGTAYVVEAVGDNDWKRIWLVSAYMQKNSSAKSSQSETVTQTPHAGTSLGHNVQNENASPVDTSIPESAQDVNPTLTNRANVEEINPSWDRFGTTFDRLNANLKSLRSRYEQGRLSDRGVADLQHAEQDMETLVKASNLPPKEAETFLKDIGWKVDSTDLPNSTPPPYAYGFIREQNAPDDSAPITPKVPAVPSPKPGVSQFAAQTGQRTSVLSDGVKQQLRESPFYQKTTQKENVDLAIQNIETEGYETRRNKLLDGSINLYTPEGQVEAYVLAKAAKDNGDAAGESVIAFRVKESGTMLGQSMAMRRMYIEMTPEGKAQFIQRIVDQINQNYANRKKKTRVEAPAWLAERLEQAKGDDEQIAKVLDDAYAAIAEQMPPDWKSRMDAWRYTAMLANPRTHIRNFAGNLLFMPAVSVKNKIGALAELTVAKDQRTKSLAPVKQEYKDFAKQQLDAVADVLTGGGKHNPMDEIQSKRRTFNNALLEWVSTKNGAALEAEDAFFLNKHFTNALAGFLQARGVDTKNVDKKTLQEGLDYAILEAQKATYRDASEIADKLSKFSKDLNNSQKRSARAVGLVFEGALPFKKTPINVMRRGIEYSPVGLLSTLSVGLYDMKHGNITKADFIDRLASSMTGTGLAAVGAMLYSMGHLKLSLDEPEDELEKLTGAQEYSIELFGKSITIDWLSPSAMPLFVGGAISKLFEKDSEGFSFKTVLDAMMNIAEPVFNLSMLDGVNSLLSSASYGENGVVGLVTNAAESYATQFVPSILGAFARILDPVRRTTYTEKDSGIPDGLQYVIDSTINKLPWASKSGQPYLNAWGEEDITSDATRRVFENFISPGYINDLTNDDVETALMELFDITQNEALLPKLPSKYFTVDKQRKNLTGEEYEQLTKERGQTAKALHEQLFGNPDFLSMPAEYQVYAVQQVWDYATQQAKHGVAPNFKMDSWIQSSRDPAASIMERAQSKIKKDRADQMKSDLYTAIDTGELDTAATYVQGILDGGTKKDSLRTSISNQYKARYQAMYEAGDVEGMRELEDALLSLYIGFKTTNIRKWIRNVEE